MNSLSAIVQSIEAPANRFVSSRWAIIITILAWLLLNAPSLGTYPSVSSDEGQFGAVAWNFYTHGSFNTPIYGDVERGRPTGVYDGRLYAILVGLHFWLFGVGVMQARLSSLLGALLGSLMAWRTAKQLRMSNRAGLIAAAFYLFSWKTFLAGHRVRPDIWVAGSGLLMLYLFLRVHAAPNNRSFFILGYICSYLIDIHATTGYFTAVTCLLVLHGVAQRRFTWKHATSFLAGATAGLVVWLVLWLLPDPTYALSRWIGARAGSNLIISTATHYSLEDQLRKSAGWFNVVFLQGTRLAGFETAIAVLAVGLLLASRTPTDQLLLQWSGLTMLAFFLAPYLQSWHSAMTTPFISLLLARSTEFRLPRLSSARWSSAIGSATTACVVAAIIANAGGGISLAWRSKDLSYSSYAKALRRIISPKSNVLAEANWWFEFHDGTFTSDITVMRRARQLDSFDDWMAQAITNRRIAYVLTDERIGSGWLEVYSENDAGLYRLFMQFLEANCAYRGSVTLPYYGVEQGGPAIKRTSIYYCGHESSTAETGAIAYR